MTDRATLIRSLKAAVALARLHGGSARWGRVHRLRRTLRAMPLSWEAREKVLDALVRDASERKPT